MTCRCASWWPIRNRRFNAPLCSIHKCLLTSWWTWPGPGSLNWPAWPGNIPTSLPLKRPICVGWSRCAVTSAVRVQQLEAQLRGAYQSRAAAQGQALEAEAERVYAGLRAQLEKEHQERLRALHLNVERRLEREAGLLQASIQDRQRHAEEGLRPWRLEAAAVEAQARQDAQRHHDQALRQMIEDARLAEHQVREQWMAESPSGA